MKHKPVKNLGMVSGSFWGLLRKPDGMPCLFGSRQDAEENRDDDEYLVEVRVHPASAMALLRGEQELFRRKEAQRKAASRPRVHVDQKRRRGAGFIGTKTEAAALEAAFRKSPKDAKRLRQALGKGGRRAAAPRVRR